METSDKYITIIFEDDTTKDILIQRPFIGERIWINKFTYKVENITHVGTNILANVILINKK